MKYVTYLNKKQIIEKIRTNTEEWSLYNFLTAKNIILSKIKKNKVYLLHTGEFGVGRGHKPLILNIIENDKKTILKGGFRLTKLYVAGLIVFLGLLWFNIIKFDVLNPNINLYGKFIAVFSILIWTILAIAIVTYGDRLFFYNRRKKLMEFITNILEAERVK